MSIHESEPPRETGIDEVSQARASLVGFLREPESANARRAAAYDQIEYYDAQLEREMYLEDLRNPDLAFSSQLLTESNLRIAETRIANMHTLKVHHKGTIPGFREIAHEFVTHLVTLRGALERSGELAINTYKPMAVMKNELLDAAKAAFSSPQSKQQ